MSARRVPRRDTLVFLALVLVLLFASVLVVSAQAGPTATVKGASLNVRSGPGANYPVIAAAKKGQTFDVKGKNQDGSWLQLCCFSGKPGWASASLLSVKGDLKAVPVVKNVPAPPAAAAKPAAAKPPAASAATGKPKGVLLYSVANMDAERWEIWEYNFATGKSRMLKEWRTEVAFSKDYKQVVYYVWPAAAGDKYGIYVAAPDLSGERLIIEGGAYPSFAPGANRLSLMGGDSMWIINSDGGGLRKLGVGEYPAWSPVDDWIAYRACNGGACGLWLTQADSGETRRLTTGGGDGQPAWSPDGKKIAYISKEDGNFEIYVVNRDGSGNTRLTTTPQSDGLPVWSPDGKLIAFRSDRDGKWAIYTMRPDGTSVTKVVDADVLPLWFFEKMAWRP
jgi:Tol biopolymer transport system component/uncharacterized protein YraI